MTLHVLSKTVPGNAMRATSRSCLPPTRLSPRRRWKPSRRPWRCQKPSPRTPTSQPWKSRWKTWRGGIMLKPIQRGLGENVEVCWWPWRCDGHPHLLLQPSRSPPLHAADLYGSPRKPGHKPDFKDSTGLNRVREMVRRHFVHHWWRKRWSGCRG